MKLRKPLSDGGQYLLGCNVAKQPPQDKTEEKEKGMELPIKSSFPRRHPLLFLVLGTIAGYVLRHLLKAL